MERHLWGSAFPTHPRPRPHWFFASLQLSNVRLRFRCDTGKRFVNELPFLRGISSSCLPVQSHLRILWTSTSPVLTMAIDALFRTVQASAIEHPIQFLLFSAVVLPVAYLIGNEFVRHQARVSGLGGPKGFPVIGNLWEIRVNAAEKYRQWAQRYGAVYQIQLGNIPVVMVNSAASAKVLFGQNAQALSSRPEFYTFHKASFRSGFHYYSSD